MNLVMVTNLFPNPVEPLRGTFIASLVRALRAEVTAVVVPLPWFPKWKGLQPLRYYPLAKIPDQWEWEGIPVFCPKYFLIPKIMGTLHPLTVLASILPILSRLKKEGRCQLVNAHFIYPDGVAAYWAARRLHLPVVLSARGTDIHLYAHYRFRRRQIAHALRGASQITSVSGALVEAMTSLGIPPAKISLIGNGVDSALFFPQDPAACREKLGLDRHQAHLLFVGRLSEEKNLTTLIEAVRICQEEGQRFDLHLIGEGPMRRQWEAQARLLKHPNRIFFHGSKEPAELSLWYGAASMLCLPSLREGTPNVMLEALASGRPVLASRVGGCVEWIQDHVNGYLLSPRHPMEWATRIKEALSKTWESDIIFASVRHRTWEQTAQAYREVYRRALEGPG